MPKTSEHRLEMRRLGDSELLGRLGEARRELFNLRFQLATGQLDKFKSGRRGDESTVVDSTGRAPGGRARVRTLAAP